MLGCIALSRVSVRARYVSQGKAPGLEGTFLGQLHGRGAVRSGSLTTPHPIACLLWTSPPLGLYPCSLSSTTTDNDLDVTLLQHTSPPLPIGSHHGPLSVVAAE